eukprot:2074597-Alexandrium_andersonii.AAC.1
MHERWLTKEFCLTTRGPFEALGLHVSSAPAFQRLTADEIRAHYRREARVCHPDRNPGVPYAAGSFRALKAACDALCHPTSAQVLARRWLPMEEPLAPPEAPP